MKPSDWWVAIISTDHDLKDLRSSLASHVTDLGFKVLGFEEDDFPVEPGVHSHDACLAALEKADIVILLIDKRYGGLYVHGHGQSITEGEYDKAHGQGKVVIPCVRDKAEQERFLYFSMEKQLGDRGENDPRSKLNTMYVDSWEVLDLIEKVRKADTDNFLIYFRNPNELNSKIKGRLSGLSRYMLGKVLNVQIQTVRNMKTTTGMAFSLGDVLDDGYFIEPPYKIISGSTLHIEKASRIADYLESSGNSVALWGQPGSGKSTLLGKAYLEKAQKAVAESSYKIPFFISLRGRGADFNFTFDTYIEQCFEQYLRKKRYPLLDLNAIQPVFYVDGFDEITEDVVKIDLQKLSQSDMFQQQFAVSCRSRFASIYLDEISFGNRLSAIIELQPWGVEHVKKYIGEFCRLKHRDDLVDDVIQEFSTSIMQGQISTNPLFLTLFLWIVEQAGMTFPSDVKDKLSLFDKALELWAKRELSRIGQNGTPESREDVAKLGKAWQLAAWEIYRSRFSNTSQLTMQTLRKAITQDFQDLETICDRDVFAGLVDIRPYSDEVTGMIHEQILEYLVARALVESMKNNSHPFPDSLECVVRHEINQIIRSRWQPMNNKDKIATLQNLSTAFKEAIRKNDSNSIIKRNQASYYIGRLEIPEAVETLRRADKCETNLMVKLSIAFGLINYGQFDVEKRFLDTLKSNPDWDKANRGYHLVYYHDWQIREEAPPYYDPENVSWDNTLKALIRHIETGVLRYIALRRIELYTIRRFIETRQNRGPLDDELMQSIEQSINAVPDKILSGLPANFHENIKKEYGILEKVWAQLPRV